MAFVSIPQLRKIVKAKLSDKSKLGGWYQDRLDICKMCPMNSTVKRDNGQNLTAKEVVFVTANLGKPTCLACGCEIAAKASLKDSVCGLVEIGQEPLWDALPEKDEVEPSATGTNKIDTLRFWNHTPDKATLSMEVNGIALDYGVVPHAFDSTVEFEMESAAGPITYVKVTAGCGCTSINGFVREGRAVVQIGYDTKGRKGPVTKNFNVNYTAGGKVKVLVGKLRINVESPQKRTK